MATRQEIILPAVPYMLDNMIMKRHVTTIAVLLFLSLIQCGSASDRSIFDGKSHIVINKHKQRSLRQSLSEWSSSMYNKVHNNKKSGGGTKKCMKKHWWNTHCNYDSDTASSSYADGYNAGYEDGKSYTDGYNAGYNAASGSSSSSSNANDYDEIDEATEDYDEDASSSQAQDTSSSYIQTTQLDYTNNAEGGGGASVFLFFLAVLAGLVVVGIAGMAKW